MTWQAVLIIVGAFLLALVLGLFQHRAYQRTVNSVAAQEHRSGVLLVSGRAKGALRGAVVILVVDRARREVTRALVMEGASSLARFRECPALVGPVPGVTERATGKARRRAVEDAMGRYRRLVGMTAKPVAR